MGIVGDGELCYNPSVCNKGVTLHAQRSMRMVTKVPGRSGRVRAVFVLPSAIWADTIHVVGDFNDWDQHATRYA
jgi:hypothetical protein